LISQQPILTGHRRKLNNNVVTCHPFRKPDRTMLRTLFSTLILRATMATRISLAALLFTFISNS
ncbi:MAG: hypothetical protein ACI9HK_002600, partial [Pirellulaceae bacterium]